MRYFLLLAVLNSLHKVITLKNENYTILLNIIICFLCPAKNPYLKLRDF